MGTKRRGCWILNVDHAEGLSGEASVLIEYLDIANCNAFTDGVVHARVTKVDETNKTVTFEVANCNASAFSSRSTLYVYKGL